MKKTPRKPLKKPTTTPRNPAGNQPGTDVLRVLNDKKCPNVRRYKMGVWCLHHGFHKTEAAAALRDIRQDPSGLKDRYVDKLNKLLAKFEREDAEGADPDSLPAQYANVQNEWTLARIRELRDDYNKRQEWRTSKWRGLLEGMEPLELVLREFADEDKERTPSVDR